jgi:hypothetical protein
MLSTDARDDREADGGGVGGAIIIGIGGIGGGGPIGDGRVGDRAKKAAGEVGDDVGGDVAYPGVGGIIGIANAGGSGGRPMSGGGLRVPPAASARLELPRISSLAVGEPDRGGVAERWW